MKLTCFEDLKVWQLANRLSLEVSDLVETFPKHEKYDLTSQMRRSARSIPADISEGFGRFHFNDKLTFYERARSSLGELRNHFNEALGNGYLGEGGYGNFSKRINEVGYLLNRMMRNVQRARDVYDNKRKSKRLNSIAKQ